jgi:hypothetical protein
MADLADSAYAHACALLGPGEAAMGAALIAVRRGGRSRSAVLGHARHEGLSRAAEAVPTDLDAAAPDDLTDLAAALASTRPPIERAIVDLDTRHDLDRGGLARAIGLSPAGAAARAAAVYLEWQRALDPVVLARLGAGECEGLAAVLSTEQVDAGGAEAGDDATPGTPYPSLRTLLTAGAGVADHVEGCALCRDRLRSMVSVRTLLGQRPLEEAPAAVRALASQTRLRRPTPPPPLVPEPPARRWIRNVATAAAAIVFAVALAGVLAARRNDDGTRIEALTRVPLAGSSLVAEPAVLEYSKPTPVQLANRSSKEVHWTAAADVPWLTISPPSGALGPGDSIAVRIAAGPGAPEGDVRASVHLTGTDGSTTVVRVETSVEHPPDVAVAVAGCVVTATVEDESGLGPVDLHWLDRTTGRPAERLQRLTETDAGFTGTLANSAVATTWWVTAEDARGNHTRTPDDVLPPNACP